MEFDFFKLARLKFDPPEKNAETVANGIDDFIKSHSDRKEQVGISAEGEKLTKEIEKMEEFRKEYLESGEKKLTLKKEFKEAAKKRTETAIEEFRVTAKIWIETNRKSITNAGIKKESDSTGLSTKNIRAILKEPDIEIEIIPPPPREKPKYIQDNFNDICTYLGFIRELPDFHEKYANKPDNTKVNTLYDFLAFLKEDPESASILKTKPINELREDFEEYRKEYANSPENPKNPLAGTYKNLLNLSLSDAFKDDESRVNYDKFLLYKHESLTELFGTLQKHKQADELEREVTAEYYIEKIMDVFHDRNEAITLYNYVAEVYYDPVKLIHFDICTCGHRSEFYTIQEAMNENKCQGCDQPLYKKCDRCKKLVRILSDKCTYPGCYFVFPNKDTFDWYYKLADEALWDGNFDEARNNLLRAKLADPGEEKITTKLENEIKKEEALAKASTIFDGAKNQPPTNRANTCLEILDICADFEPALDFLAITPPEQVKGLTVSPDTINGRVTINWTRSGEKGISYRIVRKPGKEAPKNELDGDVLKDDAGETAFIDESIQPGTWFSYGVFAKRMGVYSAVSADTVLLLAEVRDVFYNQNGQDIHITWTLPDNCVAVKVTRVSNGKATVVSENAKTSFEDTGLEYRTTYTYTLQTLYFNQQPGAGVNINITPVITMEAFTVGVKKIKGNRYAVSWDMPHKDIDMRVLVNKNAVQVVKSDAGKCEIELEPNGYYIVEAAAFSGGNWINSENSVEVNAYTPLEINKETTLVSETPISGVKGSYKISIPITVAGAVPKNVTGFYCTVRTKNVSTSNAPWATPGEIGSAPDVIRIDINKYNNDEGITHSATANNEDYYYITLFTEYAVAGKTVISDPAKLRVNRPISATVQWKVTKSFFGKPKLYMKIIPNRQISQTPRFVLCGSDGGRMLSLNDSKGVPLHDVPAKELDAPIGIIETEYEITSPVGKNMSLFLFHDKENKNEDFVPRWMDKFNGKL